MNYNWGTLIPNIQQVEIPACVYVISLISHPYSCYQRVERGNQKLMSACTQVIDAATRKLWRGTVRTAYFDSVDLGLSDVRLFLARDSENHLFWQCVWVFHPEDLLFQGEDWWTDILTGLHCSTKHFSLFPTTNCQRCRYNSSMVWCAMHPLLLFPVLLSEAVSLAISTT